MFSPLALCSLALLSLAGSMPSASTPAPLASPVPAVAPAPPPVVCVKGFSKDYCNGKVEPGHQGVLGCPSPSPAPTDPCRTLIINGATFYIGVASNTATCGDTRDSRCDESRNGQFKVSSNFIIRLQNNCPYRGCWDGVSAEFTFDDGSVYKGTLMGTIGVGTHRRMTAVQLCPVLPPSDRTCEVCYDVSLNSDGNQWRVGYEAAFHGTRADVDTGQELCFSLSGDFLIRGDAASGPDFSAPWRVVGTADGIHYTFCP